MTLKHRTQTAIADDPAYDVGADEWNADHIVATDFSPETSDGATLGTSSKQWSSLYIGGTSALFTITRSGNNATGPSYVSQKTRGTGPTDHVILNNGDILGGIFSYGSDGAAFQEGGSFSFRVDGTPSQGTSFPSKWRLSTTPSGSVFATQKLLCDNGGNVVIGTAAKNTNATDGFLHIPTCAGTPTGVPTAYTGVVPLIYDTTNNKLYVYNGGWKASGVFA